MRLRYIVTVLGLALVVVTAGCTAPTDGTDSERESLSLGLNDSGRCYEVESGTEFTVRLSENPSTGYRWNVTQKEGVRIQNSTYVEPDSSKLGAPGTRLIDGVVEETGGLRAEYVRGFDDSEPEEVFEVSFGVGERCPIGSSE
ncbi:protease inhibitor I42 family protein [Halorutilales archaeon Cl-col2-1]